MRLTRPWVQSRPPPVPKMPAGLVELMEGLTRHVLQHSPSEDDIYEVCARHMEQLLVIRDGHAPTKCVPLEKRIKRAQEKVKEKAKQRRQKYNEQLKKYYEEVAKVSSSTDETDKLVLEEVKSAKESSIVEPKLKEPVHHEQDLAEALEMEIFHKPAEKTTSVVNAEVKDGENNLLQKANERDEQYYQEVENNHKSTDLNNQELDKMQQVIHGDINVYVSTGNTNTAQELAKDDLTFVDHVRSRRSVDVKELEELEKQTNKDNTSVEILEQKEHTTIIEENAGDNLNNELNSLTTNDDKNPETISEITHKIINDNNIVKSSDGIMDTIIDNNTAEVLSNELNSPTIEDDKNLDKMNSEITSNTIIDSNCVKSDDSILDTDKNIDKTTVFANEITESAPTPETDNVGKKGETDGNIYGGNEIDTPKEQLKELTDSNKNKKINSNDKLLEVEKDENNCPSKVALVVDHINLNMENQVDIKENSCLVEIPDETLSVQQNLAINNTSVHEQEDITVNKEFGSNTDRQTNEEERQEVIPITVNQSPDEEINNSTDQSSGLNNDESEKESKTYNSSEQENGTSVLNDDGKIIEVVQQLEVSSEPIKIEHNEKQEDNVNIPVTKSGSNEPLLSEMSEKGFLVEDRGVEIESIAEENNDGSLTTVNKLLVEEAEVDNDNDSAPERIINHAFDNSVRVNGTYQIMNEEGNRNGSESPETEVIPTEEIIHQENKAILDGQDDATTTSEPIKTDPETSSIGKSSSIDESFIEEGIDNITEVDVLKQAESLTNKDTNSGMDLETAAVTIQKVFRTFLFKSRGSTFEETYEGGSIDGDSEKTEVEFQVTSAPLNKERRALGISRMDTVLQTVNEEKSLSLSTDDSSLSSAATIIQAHVRGFLLRNRLNSNKINSSTSLVNSEGPSISLENGSELKANKTVLNIHIVPEGEHFLSRDESLLTSMELSLDSSPPSSTNLHPLGYDKRQPRKQLKREDAIQSISPPSNNSGKLSEDSVKDMLILDSDQQKTFNDLATDPSQDVDLDRRDDTPTKSTTIETVVEAHKLTKEISNISDPKKEDIETAVRHKRSLIKSSSDESDVVTPYEDKSLTDSDATSRLLHSGEFHDVVLPTKVSRGDTSVVRGE